MFAQAYILFAGIFILSVNGAFIIGVRPFPPLTMCVQGSETEIYNATFMGLEIEIFR